MGVAPCHGSTRQYAEGSVKGRPTRTQVLLGVAKRTTLRTATTASCGIEEGSFGPRRDYEGSSNSGLANQPAVTEVGPTIALGTHRNLY